MTLRARLVVGLIALAAAGLAIAGTVTYRQTESDLLKRVDRQLRQASRSPGLFVNKTTYGPHRPASTLLLPAGTWTQVRLLSTDEPIDTNPGLLRGSPPELPSDLTPGQLFTLSSPHYRVIVSEPSDDYTVSTPDGARIPVTAYLVVAIPLMDVDQTMHHLWVVEFFVIVGILLALGVLAWWVVNFGLRPLRNMEETAGAIAAGDLSRRVDVADENTEVGRLGIALNEMLQQIERAFKERAASEARLRRFVGDASHELRTPLTSIRGYAELFRRGAAERPEDLAKAMRRIEEEADRMGVLVDDLLLLARLDQGRPLEHNPVDLTRLARDAVDDLRTVAPTRPIDYSPNGAIMVPGDDTRLRQVLANLLTNANRHTPPETPIHVRVETVDNEAVIEVADEGPGMEPEEVERVFERFWRADPSRNRASGGVGLGLSIVAAIAEAHGGRAEVESTPGQGATFRVRLPLTEPAQNLDAQPTPPPAQEIPVAELEGFDAN